MSTWAHLSKDVRKKILQMEIREDRSIFIVLALLVVALLLGAYFAPDLAPSP